MSCGLIVNGLFEDQECGEDGFLCEECLLNDRDTLRAKLGKFIELREAILEFSAGLDLNARISAAIEATRSEAK